MGAASLREVVEEELVVVVESSAAVTVVALVETASREKMEAGREVAVEV